MTPVCLSALSLLLFASFSYAGNDQAGHERNSFDAGSTASLANFNGGRLQPGESKSKIFRYSVGGVTTFSDRAPVRGAYAVVNVSCFACNPVSAVN